jgi:hypothetical protein
MDILTCVAPKDYNKLFFSLSTAIIHIKDKIDNIIIISPNEIDVPDNFTYPVYNFTDEYMMELLGFKKTNIKYRPNWTSQQFFKLFQNIITDNDYLILDSDLLFTKDIHLYHNNKPSFFFGIDQNHDPYFNFQEKMFGFRKVYPKSFICEFFIIKPCIITDMLNRLSMSRSDFIKKSIEILNTDTNCHIGEPELYGSYVYKYFHEQYNYLSINTKLLGKLEEQWLNSEIYNAYQYGVQNKFDTVTIHTWNATS